MFLYAFSVLIMYIILKKKYNHRHANSLSKSKLLVRKRIKNINVLKASISAWESYVKEMSDLLYSNMRIILGEISLKLSTEEHMIFYQKIDEILKFKTIDRKYELLSVPVLRSLVKQIIDINQPILYRAYIANIWRNYYKKV
ncbi:MAG: hypothetical protein EOP34_12100 [Rickettsiales bacterium]|nr:MAG: hypothetical protein EOP34_12100 [Rickettsiales bacterium]